MTRRIYSTSIDAAVRTMHLAFAAGYTLLPARTRYVPGGIVNYYSKE